MTSAISPAMLREKRRQKYKGSFHLPLPFVTDAAAAAANGRLRPSSPLMMMMSARFPLLPTLTVNNFIPFSTLSEKEKKSVKTPKIRTHTIKAPYTYRKQMATGSSGKRRM